MSTVSARPIFAGFQSPAVSEAAEVRAAEQAQHGRVCELAVSLFDAAGLSLILPGKKDASPMGAHAVFAKLAAGPKPVFDKDTREALRGVVKGRPEVAQGLHALVSMLHAANACPAPAAMPAWADAEVIAKAKADAASKRAAAKAAKATTAGDTGEGEGTDAPSTTVATAPVAPAANLIAAAIMAKAYSSADMDIIVQALRAAHVIAQEEATA